MSCPRGAILTTVLPVVRRDIVVIGASAGGARALRTLAASLPADFAASVCVVLHIGAHQSSLPAAGLHAIKECGGLAVVQDPQDAKDPGMPSAALQSVPVDHCEPLERIAPLLLQRVREPAPTAAEPPPSLRHEHLAGLGRENALDELRQAGAPSMLACPVCKGTLWEIHASHPPRYRCHTGYAFSPHSLAAAQEEATEDALWAALRALQEKEALLRKIAALDRSAGDEAHALTAEAEAGQLRQQTDMLRKLVEKD
jgi:two-component system chemotaxis response regulator CheB